MKKDTQKHIRTGLTLTWDVLKYFKKANEKETKQINFNMGCFEICRKTAQQR